MKSFRIFITICVIIVSVTNGESYPEFIRNRLQKPDNSTNCPDTTSPCRLIETRYGSIIGTELTTVFGEYGNGKYCAYRGIPFGKAPVGKLRFKPPQPFGAWNGTLNASNYRDYCLTQTSISGASLDWTSSEDCLFLNVFTPNPQVCHCNVDNVPVMVYIYGGGFVEGSGNDYVYASNIIASHCVIYVSFNYRIDIFGFLSLRTRTLSGNMGLKDQKLAIQWVNENIERFGGDPNRITVFGESAGGASACYQALNEESKQNFWQIFALSSTPLNYYASMESYNHTEIVVEAVKKNGTILRTVDDMIEYLQNVDGPTLLKNTAPTSYDPFRFSTSWAPVVERPGDDQAFITREPIEIYQTEVNTVPTLLTHTPMEYFPFLFPYINDPSTLSTFNSNFSFPLAYHSLNQTACAEAIRPLFDDIRSYYFGNDTIGSGTTSTRQFVRLFSDMNFIHPIRTTVDLLAKNSEAPVRYQIHDPRTPLNPFLNSPGVAALGGAGHSEDNYYIFYSPYSNDKYSMVESNRYTFESAIEAYQFSQNLVNILVDYATNKIPMVESTSCDTHNVCLPSDTFDLIGNSGQKMTAVNQPFPSHLFWMYIEQEIEEIKKLPCNVR